MGDYWAMVKNSRSRRITAVAAGAADSERLYLAEWLKVLGIKPAKLAAATEVNEGYLSQLVNGHKTNPSRAILKRIAAELGIDWKLLFDPPPNQRAIEQLGKYGSGVIERLSRGRKG